LFLIAGNQRDKRHDEDEVFHGDLIFISVIKVLNCSKPTLTTVIN